MQIKNKIILAFIFLLILSLNIKAEEFNISAKEITVDKQNNVFTGKGSVKVTDKEADDYYKSRSYGSKIGAWASKQSTVLQSRDELINSVKHYKKKYNDEKNVPRPDHWSGWILLPKEIEFWLHTNNRIHERLKYSKDNNGNWNKFLLNP